MPVLTEVMSDLRKLIPSAHSLLVFKAAARLQSFKAAAIEMRVAQPCGPRHAPPRRRPSSRLATGTQYHG